MHVKGQRRSREPLRAALLPFHYGIGALCVSGGGWSGDLATHSGLEDEFKGKAFNLKLHLSETKAHRLMGTVAYITQGHRNRAIGKSSNVYILKEIINTIRRSYKSTS